MKTLNELLMVVMIVIIVLALCFIISSYIHCKKGKNEK